MNKLNTLVFLTLSIGATSANAQDAAAKPAGPNFEISKVGEALIRSTVSHRTKMMALQRELELETADAKVQLAKAEKEKAKLAVADVSNDVIPVVPVGRNAALPPNTITAVAPPPSSDEAPKQLDTSTVIKFVAPPVIPQLAGIIGNRGIFRVGGDQVDAVPGQPVGLFTVVSIDQTSAVLVENSDKKNRVTLQVAN